MDGTDARGGSRRQMSYLLRLPPTRAQIVLNKRVTGLSFTARIERPQLYRGGSASTKDGPVTEGVSGLVDN